MAERKLNALPWTCRACGRRHDACDPILKCRNKLCEQKDFTLSFSDLAWDVALTMFDRGFLRRHEISPE